VYFSVDPSVFGVTQVIIPFKAIDNAGFESSNTGQAVLNLTGAPDLTPRITLFPAQTNGTRQIEVFIQVLEVNVHPTDGSEIKVAIPKNSILGNLVFNPSKTQNAIGGPVQNAAWTFSQDANFYYFSTNNVIQADDLLTFAFDITVTPGGSRGRLPMTVVLINGSGGELYLRNNNDSEVLRYFPSTGN
jgi:hypothetical protein